MGFFNKMFGSHRGESAQEETDLSAALSQHLRGETAAALSRYQTILAAEPENLLAAFFSANIAASCGDLQTAASHLRQLSQMTAEKGTTISRAVVTDLLELLAHNEYLGQQTVGELIVANADRLKECAALQESAVCYEIASALIPDAADLYYKFGDTLHDLRNYPYAEAVLKKALTLSPEHWGALYTYAVLLQDLGRFAEAIPFYQKALAQQPDHVKSLNNYGSALRGIGRLDEALEQCSRALQLAPDFILARINLGNIQLQRNEPEIAKEHFAAALVLNPEFAQAHYGLGLTALALKSPIHEIKGFFQEAIRLVPDFPLFHLTLGQLLADNNDPQALDEFAAVAELTSNSPGFRRDYGRVCLQFGKIPEAIEHLTVAVDENPQDNAAAELLARAKDQQTVH